MTKFKDINQAKEIFLATYQTMRNCVGRENVEFFLSDICLEIAAQFPNEPLATVAQVLHGALSEDRWRKVKAVQWKWAEGALREFLREKRPTIEHVERFNRWMVELGFRLPAGPREVAETQLNEIEAGFPMVLDESDPDHPTCEDLGEAENEAAFERDGYC